MFRIAVCDDVQEQIQTLRATLAEALDGRDYEVCEYKDAETLLAKMKTGSNCDVLFLDVCMPGQDGISAAREINRISPATQVIFISAYAGYALEAYEAEHIYFLQKPVCVEKLRAALSRAFERIAAQKDRRIRIPLKGCVQRILFVTEILYFERQNHETCLHMAAGGTLMTALKLSDIEPLLPEGTFARPHYSYLVNLSYVHAMTRMTVSICGGDELPISNQRRAPFLEALAKNL